MPEPNLETLLGEMQTRLRAMLATCDAMRGLLEAVVAVGSGMDLDLMLRRIAAAAIDLTGARYAALGVTGPTGVLVHFVPVGLGEEQVAGIDRWPEGKGVLGVLRHYPRPLRLTDVAEHPQSVGFPAGHPPMRSFLGVPVLVRGEAVGGLYLTEKETGDQFSKDDEAMVSALAAAAGVAIANARLYEEARRQQRWMHASAEVTTQLLSGTEQQHVLQTITGWALALSGADLAVLALPDDDGRRLTIVHADGDGADRVRGLVLEAGGSLSGQVLAGGQPLFTDDYATDKRTAAAARRPMGHLGPAYVFPLGGAGNVRGVLTVARCRGGFPFPPTATDVVASFAAQAGIALELAERRRDAERVSVYEDRDRIARDLHDQVIQRLYATCMSLQAIMPMVTAPRVAGRVGRAVDDMDEIIAGIRATIFALNARDQDKPVSLRAQVVDVVDEMTPLLGYAPEIRLSIGLGEQVTGEPAGHVLVALREALSNAARHAHASKVEVVLAASDELSLLVRDDGTGISPGVPRSGLANLSERAEQLGGTLRVGPADPATGIGTELDWRVPLTPGQSSI